MSVWVSSCAIPVPVLLLASHGEGAPAMVAAMARAAGARTELRQPWQSWVVNSLALIASSWSTTTPSNGDGRATRAWMQQQQALATKFPAVLTSGHRGGNSDVHSLQRRPFSLFPTVQAGGRTSCNDGKWSSGDGP
nr:hypothetical protein Iba_scaffold8862CG0010 [Ipomoea batatas]